MEGVLYDVYLRASPFDHENVAIDQGTRNAYIHKGGQRRKVDNNVIIVLPEAIKEFGDRFRGQNLARVKQSSAPNGRKKCKIGLGIVPDCFLKWTTTIRDFNNAGRRFGSNARRE